MYSIQPLGLCIDIYERGVYGSVAKHIYLTPYLIYVPITYIVCSVQYFVLGQAGCMNQYHYE
jgi:hypothetical protein